MSKIDKKTLYSVDSLKLRIPLDRLKTYDNSINEHLTVVDSDGNIEDEYKRKSLRYDLNGFSIYASIHNIKVDANTFKPSLVVNVLITHSGRCIGNVAP